MIPEWTSYDPIADHYADVAEPHYFARPAEDLVSMLAPHHRARFLDAGAGSGAVSRCAADAVGDRGLVVALDAAIQMLRRSRIRSRVVATLPMIPLRDRQFDFVSAAFVVTHLAQPELAIAALRRTLRAGGRIGLTSWQGSPASSEPGVVWQEVVARFAKAERLSAAMSLALPTEQRFSSLEELMSLLEDLAERHAETRHYSIKIATCDYVESRLLALTARFMKSELEPAQWIRFVDTGRSALFDRFGETLQFTVGVNFATGRIHA